MFSALPRARVPGTIVHACRNLRLCCLLVLVSRFLFLSRCVCVRLRVLFRVCVSVLISPLIGINVHASVAHITALTVNCFAYFSCARMLVRLPVRLPAACLPPVQLEATCFHVLFEFVVLQRALPTYGNSHSTNP